MKFGRDADGLEVSRKLGNKATRSDPRPLRNLHRVQDALFSMLKL